MTKQRFKTYLTKHHARHGGRHCELFLDVLGTECCESSCEKRVAAHHEGEEHVRGVRRQVLGTEGQGLVGYIPRDIQTRVIQGNHKALALMYRISGIDDERPEIILINRNKIKF